MKIKLIAGIALLAGMVGLAGCYDVGPGGYGYGGGGGYPGYAYSQPVYGSGYAPGAYYGGGYPVYSGSYWHGGDWDHDHWRYPEHEGFVAHNYNVPNHVTVAHNEGFHGGYGGFHGAESHPAAVRAPASNFHASGGGAHAEAAHGGHGDHR